MCRRYARFGVARYGVRRILFVVLSVVVAAIAAVVIVPPISQPALAHELARDGTRSREHP